MLLIKPYIYQKILKNKVHHHFRTKYEAAKLFSTLIIITCFLSQINCTISKWSCDTENWSNDEENYALFIYRYRVSFYNILKLNYFWICYTILLYNTILLLFKLCWSNKLSLDEQKIFISKSFIINFFPKLLYYSIILLSWFIKCCCFFSQDNFMYYYNIRYIF